MHIPSVKRVGQVAFGSANSQLILKNVWSESWLTTMIRESGPNSRSSYESHAGKYEKCVIVQCRRLYRGQSWEVTVNHGTYWLHHPHGDTNSYRWWKIQKLELTPTTQTYKTMLWNRNQRCINSTKMRPYHLQLKQVWECLLQRPMPRFQKPQDSRRTSPFQILVISASQSVLL